MLLLCFTTIASFTTSADDDLGCPRSGDGSCASIDNNIDPEAEMGETELSLAADVPTGNPSAAPFAARPDALREATQGVAKLRSKELLQASREMANLVQQAAQIPDIEDESLRQKEWQLWMNRAELCLDHAKVSRCDGSTSLTCTHSAS